MTDILVCIRTLEDWKETITSEMEGGPKITRALVTYGLDGSIVGKSALDYSMVYLPDGGALFLGYEQISGSFHGATGSVVLRHEGNFQGSGAAIDVQVVPDSGTGSLAGMSGSGSVSTDLSDYKKGTLELKTALNRAA